MGHATAPGGALKPRQPVGRWAGFCHPAPPPDPRVARAAKAHDSTPLSVFAVPIGTLAMSPGVGGEGARSCTHRIRSVGHHVLIVPVSRCATVDRLRFKTTSALVPGNGFLI